MESLEDEFSVEERRFAYKMCIEAREDALHEKELARRKADRQLRTLERFKAMRARTRRPAEVIPTPFVILQAPALNVSILANLEHP